MIPVPEQLTALFIRIARVSLQACVLVVFIMVVQALLGRKLPSSWRYLLWLVLLIKLALPWSPESRISVYNLFPTKRASEALVAIADKVKNQNTPHKPETSSQGIQSPRSPNHDPASGQISAKRTSEKPATINEKAGKKEHSAGDKGRFHTS